MQSNVYLHALSVPQLGLPLSQPCLGFFRPLTPSRIAGLGQVLHSMGPVQHLHAPVRQKAQHLVPDPFCAIVYRRDLVHSVHASTGQFSFQRWCKGSFVTENGPVAMTLQLRLLLTSSLHLIVSYLDLFETRPRQADELALLPFSDLRDRDHLHFPIAFLSNQDDKPIDRYAGVSLNRLMGWNPLQRL